MLFNYSASTPGPFAHLVKQNVRARTAAKDGATAREAIGTLEQGRAIVGVTKGEFSMLDLIGAVLDQTGPADVDVSTWTMGVYDADVLWRFANRGDIRSIRFLLDPSMFGGMGGSNAQNRKKLADEFMSAFGASSLRAVNNHAKFTLIGNGEWKIAISSSMNLNRNKRLENFVLMEDAGVYAFYRDIVDRVFEQVGEYWQRSEADKDFSHLRLSGEGAADVW